MNEQKLHLYSIMPLDTDHLEEICRDILAQYEQGVATCPLFCMTLVPEGDPPADKAALLCEKYVPFRDRLRELGVPSGILVQATIGHGWALSEMFPFQRYTNFSDGTQTNTACPFDPGFRDYIYKALKTIAAAGPDTIMIDDDFRLIGRKGRGRWRCSRPCTTNTPAIPRSPGSACTTRPSAPRSPTRRSTSTPLKAPACRPCCRWRAS